MKPDPTFIDVGILYLFALGVTTALIILGVDLARRLATSGFDGAWRRLRNTVLYLTLTLTGAGLAIAVLMTLAYGVGWVVHFLGWWPY
ncbi:hypothetical protein MARCHEWKA_04760 [Brevundimonas phage vB_BpoS-Marchewka]|uniref:Uncharacterized protein n=1 Tax=Brevundimonas phage vB_BpoS-Marchewka TaxID=2948604 RepID=A0A9E7N392_9CAUD|nr:hypothetical protein MARCHEWKA_04760 [Brevundimonas phage vB_BpoS-Marchewka]